MPSTDTDLNPSRLSKRPKVVGPDTARQAENVRNRYQRWILFGTFIFLILNVIVLALLLGFIG